MAKAAALSLALLAAFVCASTGASPDRKLLLFLIDGLRYDYISDRELQDLPGFKAVVDTGVKAEYLTPSFPSLSYPNYYTLMTGLHCEAHQMIGNYMWDAATNLSFDIGTNKDSLLPMWWNGAEPLWVTMENAQKNVSMYYWPGCEVEIHGVRPNYCREYYNMPSDANFSIAVKDAVQSLSNGSADMAAVYYERVDAEGHHHGPFAGPTRDATKVVDRMLTDLLKEIKAQGLQENLNVVLFSDHGMTDIGWLEKVIELENYINMSDLLQMKDRGPVVNLWPAEGKHSEIYQKLKAVKNMNVYEKDQIPDGFYYKKGRFVSPLTLVADQGWFIAQSIAKLPYWDNGTGLKEGWQHGWHGYDNQIPDMRGFFLAFGPDFLSNFRAPGIRTVDVYNLLCNVTGTQPQPNNGSWYSVMRMLRSAHSNAGLAQSAQHSCCLVALLLLFLFA